MSMALACFAKKLRKEKENKTTKNTIWNTINSPHHRQHHLRSVESFFTKYVHSFRCHHHRVPCQCTLGKKKCKLLARAHHHHHHVPLYQVRRPRINDTAYYAYIFIISCNKMHVCTDNRMVKQNASFLPSFFSIFSPLQQHIIFIPHLTITLLHPCGVLFGIFPFLNKKKTSLFCLFSLVMGLFSAALLLFAFFSFMSIGRTHNKTKNV